MQLLKIAILAQLASPTITEQLAPTLRKRGHSVDVLDLSTVSDTDFINQPEIQSLGQYDLVYYRSGLNPDDDPERTIALEKFLHTTQTQTINLRYTEQPLANSKIYETQQAKKHGLLVPKSLYNKPQDFNTASAQLGLPLVIKTDLGTNGVGVHLVNNQTDYDQILATYPETPLLFQEFIAHDFEYRAYVIAGELICIYKKAPPQGDFRSNEAQGGEMLKAESDHLAALTELAQATAQAFVFEIFVGDFMLSTDNGEFYFTEINLNPGWGQTEPAAAGVDMIALMADYFERISS